MNGSAVRRVSWTARALFVAVLALSLYLRLDNLGAFMTIDEWSWRQRSIAFRSALQEHKLASTYQSEHPGVVDMWIGSAADILEWDVGPVGSGPDDTGQGIPGLTLWARRIIAVATWCGILAMYGLLRRLWGERIATAGAALVALDPFYLAHSRFHHLDALLTTVCHHLDSGTTQLWQGSQVALSGPLAGGCGAGHRHQGIGRGVGALCGHCPADRVPGPGRGCLAGATVAPRAAGAALGTVGPGDRVRQSGRRCG